MSTRTLPISLPQTVAALASRIDRQSRTGYAQSAGNQQFEGSAHAKAILFGEHAVVYGSPAIAVPIHELAAEARVDVIDAGVRIESELFSGKVTSAPPQLQPVVTAVQAALEHCQMPAAALRVQLLSAIPHSRGLGSSAAVAAAIARAVAAWAGRQLNATELYDIVQQAERVAHGNPSGLDARAVTAAGAIRFDYGVLSPLSIGAPLNFVLADTGVAGSTAEAVGAVRRRRSKHPAQIDRQLAALAEIAEGAIADLATGDRTAIGDKMLAAQQALSAIGVSSAELQKLVTAACREGALGAKLTGGGLGGCVIALAASANHAEHLASALRSAGAPRTWTATVPVA